MQTNKLLASAGLAIALIASATAANAMAPPIFETNFGSAIVSGDDATTTGSLPFSFAFYGQSYTGFEASTNGFVSLDGSNGQGCCNGNAGDLLNGAPRIAAEWFDIVGTVYLNTDTTGRAVFTWTGFEYNAGGSYTAQAQLFDDGHIILGFAGPSAPVGHASLTGISTGGGVSNPGGSVFSGANFTTNAGAVYQEFAASTFDLNGQNVIFTPTGQGGYDVSNTLSGAVPEPASWALMLSGFLGAGATLRANRRRRVAVTA
jgi:hypothetical protein